MITPEQREERKRFIGSSDAPAVFGVHPRMTRRDLWAIKSGLVEPEGDGGNAATEAGNFLESALVRWCETKTGLRAQRTGDDDQTGIMLVHDNRVSAANLDAFAPRGDNEAEVWECKTTGLVSAWVDDDGNLHNAIDLRNWGAEESDEVPEHVKVQVYHQLAVARNQLSFRVPVARVPALIGGRGLVMFALEASDEITDAILAAEEDFMRLVRTGEPPEEDLSLDIAKRIHRIPNKCVELESSLVEEWQEFKAAESAAKKEKEDRLARILTQLGDAEAGSVPGGTFTYYSQHRSGYTVEPCDFRVARFSRAAKKGKKS